ncbi:MAG: SDR family oxidoreductase [Rhodospirillaceae bacterium]
MNTQKKTVLVTGGTRGIGRAIVGLFAQRGWDVIFTFVSSDTKAHAIASNINARALSCDNGSEEEILKLFETLDGEGIKIDALVNNAGISGPRRRVEDVTWETLENVWRVNYAGVILFCREAVKRMSTANGGRGGSIVSISSTSTKRGAPGQWVDYAGLKGAIDVFTDGLAREVGAEGIRVNAVAPGFVETDMAREGGHVDNFETALKTEIPLARIGTTEEIAEAVHWLCSAAATYVTGTVLNVAGGR